MSYLRSTCVGVYYKVQEYKRQTKDYDHLSTVKATVSTHANSWSTPKSEPKEQEKIIINQQNKGGVVAPKSTTPF